MQFISKIYRAARRLRTWRRRHKRNMAVRKTLGLDIKDPFQYPHETQQGTYTYSVVSAVYRVEKYLHPMLSSLLRQSLDFKRHIQVILVDDGSDDGSSAICKQWASRLPDNIIYIRKENGGQATARNAGLPHATGDWVTFIDPDDIVDKDYFLEVDAALSDEINAGNISLIACNLIMFFEQQMRLVDRHPLRYRFQHGRRRVMLDDNCDDIQLSAATAFFNREQLHRTSLTFSNIRPNAEDMHFIARHLISAKSQEMLIVPKARYYYRKRSDKSSTLDTSWSHAGRYSVVLRSYLDLINISKKYHARSPRWLQRTILYDTAWHFRRLLNQYKNSNTIPDNLRDIYPELLHKILIQIDHTIIQSFEIANLSDLHRLAILSMAGADVTYAAPVGCIDYDYHSNQICLHYYFTGLQPELMVRIGANVVQPASHKIRVHRFLEKTLVREYIGWFPWEGNGSLSLFINGIPEHRSIKNSAKEINVKRFTPRVYKPNKFPLSVKAYRWLSQTQHYKNRFGGAWLLMDRDTQADDNAEHLYRHILAHHADCNAWFILRKDSHDWARLEAEGFRLLAFGSLDHKMALLNAQELISSHADHYVVRYLPSRYYRDQMRWRFTFLQHGVTKDDLSSWLNSKPIRNFIVSSDAERASISDDETAYKFTDREVALTGFPRHDRLSYVESQSASKNILIMPTWRQSLEGKTKGTTSRKNFNPDLLTSDFFQNWHTLLINKELHRISQEMGYNLIFFPHVNLNPYLDNFRTDGVQVVSHGKFRSIQDVFLDAALLITDFSSVAFEMAYLNRPVLYYQFDREFVFGGGHTTQKGYFDYERDGFGPVCLEQEALLKALEASLVGGCQVVEPYRQRMANVFAYRDGCCSERVYQRIVSSAAPSTLAGENPGQLSKTADEVI